MKVKMFAPLAGPDRAPAFIGDVIEVSDEEGKNLIDRKFAEAVEEPAPAPVVAVAAEPAPEPEPEPEKKPKIEKSGKKD